MSGGGKQMRQEKSVLKVSVMKSGKDEALYRSAVQQGWETM